MQFQPLKKLRSIGASTLSGWTAAALIAVSPFLPLLAYPESQGAPLGSERPRVKVALGDDEEADDGPGEVLGTYSYTRQLAFFYEVQLFDQTGFTKEFVKILEKNDPDLRRCFAEEVEDRENLKGSLMFSFVASSRKQGLESILFKRGGPKEDRMINCLNRGLSGLSVPVKHSLLGVVTFKFEVK